MPATDTDRTDLAMVSVHVDSSSHSFLVLLPCSCLISLGPYRVPLLRAPALSPLLLLLPLGLQGCFSHSCSPSVIAHGKCFALSEQLLSLRHCHHSSRAQLTPAVAALELSGSDCVHCLAAPDTTHTGLLAAPASGQLHSTKLLQEEAIVF